MATTASPRQARLRPSRVVHAPVLGLTTSTSPRTMRTIADPDLIDTVRAASERLRNDKKALLEHYVRLGILTPTGQLTKKFGGD